MKGVALLLALLPLAASAATITATTTADNTTAGNGQCTLREAIANVNAAADTTAGDCAAGSGAGDTIVFAVRLPATVKLRLGELAIAQDVEIAGPAAGLLAIDGRNRTRVLHITGGSTSISDLTIQKGLVVSREGDEEVTGGGVMVDSYASLFMTNCTLRANNAVCRGSYGGAAYGGGIEVDGTATLTNSTLVGNHAGCRGSYGIGGGMSNFGTATLTNCTLAKNSAVGLYAQGAGVHDQADARLTDCTLVGNKARSLGAFSEAGGGAVSTFIGTATLTNCTFNGNKATASAFASGGGIDVASSAVTLTNCSFSGNTATAHGRGSEGHGGGIGLVYFYGGTATLTNCTLNGNNAVGVLASGGGIARDTSSNASVTLTNTLVANNGRSGNCYGVNSGGHNLSSDDSCSAIGSDFSNTNPMLAPLADYGGPTETLALCTGAGLPDNSCTGPSPAVDAGDDTVTGPPDNLSTDQRGLPRRSGAHVDIGAYEAQ